MTVASILSSKPGASIISCTPDDTIADISKVLAKHRIGAVLIIDSNDSLLGIVSERDIVRMIAAKGDDALATKASQFMVKDVTTCLPSDSITSLMGLMTENRVRHIPVVIDGSIEGIVTIGDVVKARIAAAEREAAEMMHYITSGV